MNLYLHGAATAESPIERADALNSLGSVRYDVVLTNPPFGRKQGYKIVGDDGEIESEREEYNRPDFIKTTSNKQLNFLQHIMSVLKENGRAAVVLPDNVLFEGGGAEIRKRLLDNYDFHTLATPAHRHLLQARCQGQRAVLRSQAGVGDAMDQGAMDLRFPDQQEFHLEGAAVEAGRP